MGYKIKASRYVEICKKTLQRATRYRNSAPWNCGYYDGQYLWGDCWCFNPKVILWSDSINDPVCDNYTVGKYYYTSGIQASGMPDVTGDYIMNNFCTKVSFSKMLQDKKAPCLLLITGQHMGAYIGEWTENGKTYNTCEYTSNSMLGNGLCPSYCDENGARRTYKGGAVVGYWNTAGYLTDFVDYSDSGVVPTPTPVTPSQDDQPTEPVAADIISYLPVVAKGSKNDFVKGVQEELIRMKYLEGNADGICGDATVKAITDLQSNWNKVDKKILVDGSFGPQSWKKLLG